MTRHWRIVFLLVTASAVPAWGEASDDSAFDRRVAPVLVDRCLDCHSGPEPKGSLDLSSRRQAMAGGDSGPAIVPGQLEASVLWQRVHDDEMPPDHPLDAEEKEVLRGWIAGGAAWGSDPIDRFHYSTSRRAGTDWWSFQPVQRSQLPSVKQRDWPVNAVDHFVLERLEAVGLTPSPEASPRVLIRRLYFDLLGLPPTFEEVQAFETDTAPDAYERLVDRVLASPHYGERWARHWLDIVRFGESDGFERNMPRRHAWPYRDWVITALNRGMPYDRFVRLQIAGDVLEPEDAEAIRATGFLVAGLHNTVVANNDLARSVARHEEMEDLIGTFGQALMGLTVQCARCHDHKFDPIAQSDYYRMLALLGGIQHGERPAESQSDRIGREQQLRRARAIHDQSLAHLQQMEATAVERVLQQRGTTANTVHLPVAPIARWSFEGDARDSIAGWHGELQGSASIREGRLHLNGTDAFVVTAPITRDVQEKTFEAWVSLAGLEQRGGGVVSLEAKDGTEFDAIVYGERQSRRWMAGSNGFIRTKDLEPAEDESSENVIVHVAISYSPDGTITLYRNGQPVADAYRPSTPSPVLFASGQSRILFGKRHTGGGQPWLSGNIEEARLYAQALTPDQVEASFAAGPNVNIVTREQWLATLSDAEHQQYQSWVEQQEKAAKVLKTLAEPAKVYAALSNQPAATHVLIRGDVQSPGDQVAPSSLHAIASQIGFTLPPDAPEAERRKALATWITAREHPLFARVMVNRLWHHHFGRGLVETPSDFGFNGGQPSHPELLNWLAAEFIDGNFQLKEMHRLLVTSRTYRQSARQNPAAMLRDADNRWLWRKTPQRLQAEALRDAMLVVSGDLNSEMGGPGFYDVREYFNSGTTYFEPLEVHGPEFFRRTIYRFSPRGERSALLDTFDCPDPSVATPRRQVTTTPLQALALLNDWFTMHVAKQAAERAHTRAERQPDHDTTIRHAFQFVLQRQPTANEMKAARLLVEQHGLPLLCRALINSHEFVIIE